MTRKLILSVFLFFTLYGSCFSQTANITISGSDPRYAGEELEFFYYRERIYDTYETLASIIPDSSGLFSVSFSLDKTQCVYCQTPLYSAYIFAEPGNSYRISLPPLPEKEDENLKNPFFIPPLWHMVPDVDPATSSRELNAEIYEFNKQYDPFLDKQILLYYNSGKSTEKLDSFRVANSNFLSGETNETLKTYCTYKMACLGFTVSQFNHNELYEQFLKDKPVHENVSSWWEFFNLYYDRYFSSLSAKNEYSQIYTLIGSGNYSGLNQVLKNDPALQNDRIREWVILKELRNAYYENGLPLKTVISLCDSLSERSSDNLSISISGTLKKEASSLLPGNIPPYAEVSDFDGNRLEISSLQGKYSYIGFCSLDNLECLQEFEYLKYFFYKHGKYLEIIIILPESEKNRIPSFSDENSIPWKFWYSPDKSKILKDYKVRSYPVFYLLDREGKLIMSPATLPSVGFERQLFSILKGRNEI
jgi:hypothetical protein